MLTVLEDREEQLPEALPRRSIEQPIPCYSPDPSSTARPSNQYTSPIPPHQPGAWAKYDDNGPAYLFEADKIESKRSSSCTSLSRSSLAWLISVVLIIIAAGVGGGVGGSRAVAQAKQECSASLLFASQSGQSILTQPTPVQSGDVQIPASVTDNNPMLGATSDRIEVSGTATWGGPSITSLPIPRRENFTYAHLLNGGTTFDVFYEFDVRGGPGANGNALTDSLEGCINACVLARDLHRAFDSAVGCMAATWRPDISNDAPRAGYDRAANCFLTTTATGGTMYRDTGRTVWYARVQDRNDYRGQEPTNT